MIPNFVENVVRKFQDVRRVGGQFWSGPDFAFTMEL